MNDSKSKEKTVVHGVHEASEKKNGKYILMVKCMVDTCFVPVNYDMHTRNIYVSRVKMRRNRRNIHETRIRLRDESHHIILAIDFVCVCTFSMQTKVVTVYGRLVTASTESDSRQI